MKVILSGYNVDLDGLKEVKKNPEAVLTPETFSAAYARISRSPKTIPHLRAIARHEITKARDQNRRIIYEMGHHSVAEHSVFNFDIIRISRLAVEYLESHRLMSYTEASQRYIRWATQYLIPNEIKKANLTKLFFNTIKNQVKAYNTLAKELNHFETKFAKPIEDARYVTSLAMTTQLGTTMNARNLELLIRRFASSNIEEVQKLGRKLFDLVIKVAPSVILFYEKNNFDCKTYLELEKIHHRDTKTQRKNNIEICRLIDYTKDGDEKLITSLYCKANNSSFDRALKVVKKLTQDQKLEIIKTAFKYAKLYDVALREFEHVYLTFELILSASCFAQLKRHRIASITTQAYNLNLGVTIPDTIKESKQTDLFNQIIEKTEKTYDKIYKTLPHIAPYILTQAHRRRVLLTVNLRELYHIARLRMDQTAQWDIRELTNKIVEETYKVMPLSLTFCCAKDQYDKIYQRYFNN